MRKRTKFFIIFILLIFLFSNIYIAKAEELIKCGSTDKKIQFYSEINDDMTFSEKIKYYVSKLNPAATFEPEENMIICADSMTVGSFGADVRMSIKKERYVFTEGEKFNCYAFVYMPYNYLKLELYRFNEGTGQWTLIEDITYPTKSGYGWAWVGLYIDENWSNFGRYKLISYKNEEKVLEKTFEIAKEDVQFNLADESRNGFVNEDLIVKFDKTIAPKKNLQNYVPEYTFYIDDQEYNSIKLSHNDEIQTTMRFQTEGEHTVKLKFTAKRWINNIGYVNTYYYAEDIIYIENKPTEFMVDLPNICNVNENFEIKPTIIIQGSCPIVKYKVNYGNGDVKEFNANNKILYAYNKEGNYQIQINAIDSNNNEYPIIVDLNVYFIDNIVSLNIPKSANINEKFLITFKLDQKGSYDINKIEIDFGNNIKQYDVSNIEALKIYHSYDSYGSKIISLTTYDSNNNQFLSESAIIINEINSKYNISYDPITALNKDFNIDIKIKEQGTYTIKKYIIDYGDGSIKEYNINNIQSYKYKNSGIFNIKIIAYNELGNNEEIFKGKVNVLNNGDPTFYAIFNINGLNLTTNVILQDKGLSNFKNLEIDYGDGIVLTYNTMKNITYQYQIDNAYKIKINYIDDKNLKYKQEYQIILDKQIINNNIDTYKMINTDTNINKSNKISLDILSMKNKSNEQIIYILLIEITIIILALFAIKKTKK